MRKTPAADAENSLYKFGDEFAEVHPEDAAAIVAYNQSKLVAGKLKLDEHWPRTRPQLTWRYSVSTLPAAAEDQLLDKVVRRGTGRS